jgi:hypothetical protein
VSDPINEQEQTANREVRRHVAAQAEASAGWTSTARYGETAPRWADELIRQYNEAARDGIRACPHLQQAPAQASIWLALAPDLQACQRPACGQALVRELERRLGHSLKDEPSRCSVCGARTEVRGVSVGVEMVMLRGMICPSCEAGTAA